MLNAKNHEVKKIILLVYILTCPSVLFGQTDTVDLELDLALISQWEQAGSEWVKFELTVINCCNRLNTYTCSWSIYEPKLKFTVPRGLEIPTDGSAFTPATGQWANRYDFDRGIFTIPYLSSCDRRYSQVRIEILAKLTDRENANLMVEVYKVNEADRDLPDIDSRVNNGVDTDGDGNISDDPDDEDDGMEDIRIWQCCRF